jgi:hypothetical protein
VREGGATAQDASGVRPEEVPGRLGAPWQESAGVRVGDPFYFSVSHSGDLVILVGVKRHETPKR